ncbi:MAG: stage V sporulation protein AC [Peptococcaceae bacterium]|jgi:stage V sporulation protein AC|nr:stage V sporulation protein AC [Peptococcaceae bacterium]
MENKDWRSPAIGVTPQEYADLVTKETPKPTLVKNLIWAFVVGGLICACAQIMINALKGLGLTAKEASNTATAIVIFFGALLTGFGVYDELVKRAGAGGIVPVSGFANSIVAPALEFKREGFVTGVGARIFTVAGPVLVFGIITSIGAGLCYFLLHR